jgi:ATP-grasp ribosomal peptide maturase
MTVEQVLVLAQGDDGGADLVVDALRARQVSVARLDTADFPADVALTARPDQPGDPGHLRIGRRIVPLSEVSAVYRSHPARPVLPADLSGPERRFATLESVYGLGGVLAAQRWRWVDHPAAAADASYKPHQLAVAAGLGLAVPPSLVTNDGAAARAFLAQLGDGAQPALVYKTLGPGVLTEADELRIVYTSQLTADDLDPACDAAIAVCPVLLQAWVPKAYDARLTAVGDRCFAVAVQTSHPEAHIDWRCRYDQLTYQTIPVPPTIAEAVRAFLRRFGLRFGTFDFSVTPDGSWWFLECNPAGRWAWLVEETGLPIAEALADELTRPEHPGHLTVPESTDALVGAP